MDIEEAATVKFRAATLLLNLLNQWDDVQKSGLLPKPLRLPDWSAIEDFTKMLSHIFWLPSLSGIFRLRSESIESSQVHGMRIFKRLVN
jgi:hypothetical protein